MKLDIAREQLILLGYRDGDPVHYRFIPVSKGNAQNVTKVFPEIATQPKGFKAYFVVNGGGQKDADVIRGRAIFFEHDDLAKDLQINLWEPLGLPEPTVQLDTGGKSIHTYWVFDQPISIEQWRELQEDLLEFADADRTIKNPSRVMRLAGSLYYPKGSGDPVGVASIVGRSGKRYSYETLRAAIPSRHRTPVQTPTQSRNGRGSGDPIPLEKLMAREHRDLIASGVGEGSRNATLFQVVADAIGCEGWARNNGIPVDGTARDIAHEFAGRCTPPLDDREVDQVFKSAERSNATACLTDDKLQTCWESWQRKNSQPTTTGKPKGVGDPKPDPTAAGDPDEEYKGLILQIHEIVTNSENRSVERFRLGKLAQKTKIRIAELKGIYRDHIECQRETPILSLREFLSQAPQEREWLISGLLPKSTTGILHAAPGVGKTLLGYELARAVAAGGEWNGFPVSAGRVLIVQTDEPSSETAERLKIMGLGDEENTAGDNVAVLMDWSFVQIPKLEKWISEQRPAFVLIDSLTSANRGSQTEESDAPYADGLYSLRDISNRYGCTILVIHHSNKAGEIRGSTAIDGAVSEVWNLCKPSKEENLGECHRILKIGKSRAGLTGSYLIELDPDDYRWKWHGDYRPGQGSQEIPPSSEGEILRHFKLNRRARIGPAELASHGFCGGNTNTASQALSRLHRRGLLIRERVVPTQGKWFYLYTLPSVINPVIRLDTRQDRDPDDIPDDKDESVINPVIRLDPRRGKDSSLMTDSLCPPPWGSESNQSDQPRSPVSLNGSTTTPGGVSGQLVISPETQTGRAFQPNDSPNDRNPIVGGVGDPSTTLTADEWRRFKRGVTELGVTAKVLQGILIETTGQTKGSLITHKKLEEIWERVEKLIQQESAHA